MRNIEKSSFEILKRDIQENVKKSGDWIIAANLFQITRLCPFCS